MHKKEQIEIKWNKLIPLQCHCRWRWTIYDRRYSPSSADLSIETTQHNIYLWLLKKNNRSWWWTSIKNRKNYLWPSCRYQRTIQVPCSENPIRSIEIICVSVVEMRREGEILEAIGFSWWLRQKTVTRYARQRHLLTIHVITLGFFNFNTISFVFDTNEGD